MSGESNRVVVLGLGGGGGAIVAELARDELLDAAVSLGVADTDQHALERLQGVVQIPLGRDWTGRQGCGGDVTLGEKAATASVEDLRQFLADARLVIVVAGLSGGTGSSAVRVTARLLRQMDLPSLFVVTTPFAFEGNWRATRAEQDLQVLRDLADAVMAIPGDLLFTALPGNTPAARAFETMATILAEGIGGLTRLNQATALLPVDYAAFRALLKEKPALCMLGVGHGAGADRWQLVMRSFCACPLVGGAEALAKADAAVITLIGNADLSVGEMQNCLTALQQQFRAGARVLVGVYTDPRCVNEVRLTGLICRFAGGDSAPLQAAAPPAATPPPGRRSRRKGPTAADQQQGELPLLEQALGIFSGVVPTTIDGENWDIPTYQRRGVQLDQGS